MNPICNLQFASFTSDPAWPFSLSAIGLPGLLVVALILVGLTVWTYRGVPKAGNRRVSIILALRLLALILAILCIARPSFASKDDEKRSSVLVLLIDDSESMSIQDASDSQSRWKAVQRSLANSESALKVLRDEQNVTVKLFRFSADVADYDPKGEAKGPRSEYGLGLLKMNEQFAAERYLRALLVIGDGADNGTRAIATAEAEKFRARSVPVHTFVIGQTTTTSRQRDVALTSIIAEPSPVPVKGKLTVRVQVDAPGFEGEKLRYHLLIDGQEAGPAVEEVAQKATGNEVKLSANAPEKAGEIKVTVKVEQQPGEVSTANNEITTYVTVSKEGLSVLYVGGRIRWEQRFMREALAKDPRIRLFEINRFAPAPGPGDLDLFGFDKQHYDVIILGDLRARQLGPEVLQKMHDLVEQKGTGLMMTGGFDTFGNSDWQGTPIAKLLPVELDARGQIETSARMLPTADGVRHYLLRLGEPDDQAVWEKLPPFDGVTKLGTYKKGATVLARANDAKDGAPLLVSQQYGKGRVLAFAGDTTWRWTNFEALTTKKGPDIHARFWKQLALWLAQQEESTGNVWVRPETRRLPVAGKQGIEVGLRGKTGLELADARFEVNVTDPKGATTSVPVTAEKEGQRGVYWKTEAPGEYRIVVKGSGKDSDGGEISGEVSARFLVYQDATEMAVQGAKHEYMARLAAAGGGKAYRAEDLPRYLQELQNVPFSDNRQKVQLYPDWRSSQLGPILPMILLLFVGLLCSEWFLRRRWGLV